MTGRHLTRLALVLAVAVVPAARAAGDAPPASSEVQQRLLELEEQVRFLTGELQRLKGSPAPGTPAAPIGPAPSAASEARTAELERKVEALTDEVAERRMGVSFGKPLASRWGLGPAASKVYDVDQGVSIGGYGEMLYQSVDSTRDDGSRSSRKDQLDFLRAVLYVGYRFSDRFVFNSEIEFEHANTGEGGAVEVEFAHVDFLLHEAFNLRAGVMLVPMGLVNEMHEPTTFWSARRPQVESSIIPSTWSENGVGFFGEAGRVSYRGAILAGLDASGFSAGSGVRGGRQHGSESLAEDLAATARIDVEAAPGLKLGVAAYVGDSGQDAKVAGEEIDVRVTLWDLHLAWQWKGFGLRGLWVQGEIDSAEDVNALLGLAGDDSIGSRLEGFYGEAGFDVLARLDTDQELIPFARFESLDTQARVPAGFLRDPANDRDIWTFGVAYKPHPQVVIKVDWQDVENEAGTGNDQLNAAVGYSF